MEAWRVNSGFVDTDFLAVAWLKFRSVLTFCYVNLGIVVSTAMRKVDVDLSVLSVVARKVDVNLSVVVSTVVW